MMHARIRSLVVTGIAALVVAMPAGAAEPSGPTPAEALAHLKDGNARFVAGTSEAAAIGVPRRTELVAGQHPFAIVLSCADSRVPPEHIFNVGLGDLFVVRTAGEVTDRAVLASVEYAAEHLHVPLLVVMGHGACGAVKAASEAHKESLGPNLDYLVNAIHPAVERSAGVAGRRAAEDRHPRQRRAGDQRHAHPERDPARGRREGPPADGRRLLRPRYRRRDVHPADHRRVDRDATRDEIGRPARPGAACRLPGRRCRHFDSSTRRSRPPPASSTRNQAGKPARSPAAPV